MAQLERQTFPHSAIVHQEPVSENGAGASIPDIKPLTPEQLSVIDNFKEGSIDRFIAQLLVDRRKQGKPTAMEEFVDSYISIYRNNNHNADIPYKEDPKRKIRDLIERRLRKKFKPVDLFVVNYYQPGKKGGSFYFLRTREELPSQEELDQLRTLRDLSEAIDEPNLLALRSRVYAAMKQDPTIRSHRLAIGGDSKKLFFKQDAFEKLIEASKATKKVAKNGKNNEDNTLDDQDDDETKDAKRNPFRHEFHNRALLGRTEQIREELIVLSTDVILSHLLIGVMEELSRDAKELLEDLLPRYGRSKMQLSLLIREPVEQFFVNRIVKRVEELWAKHPNSANSQHDRRTINYCLQLRQKYTLQSMVDIMYQHFSLPNPSASAPGPEFPKGAGRF